MILSISAFCISQTSWWIQVTSNTLFSGEERFKRVLLIFFPEWRKGFTWFIVFFEIVWMKRLVKHYCSFVSKDGVLGKQASYLQIKLLVKRFPRFRHLKSDTLLKYLKFFSHLSLVVFHWIKRILGKAGSPYQIRFDKSTRQ